jgi:hypothetical protein
LAAQKVPEPIRQQVSQRANKLCEYCHACEQWQYVRFTVDHIIPLTQGGQDTLDNLALACFHCNRKKGAKTTAIAPLSGTEVPQIAFKYQQSTDAISSLGGALLRSRSILTQQFLL